MNSEAQDEAQKKVVVVTGGGTGGHLYPAIAVAQALIRNDASLEIIFIGRQREKEQNEVERRGIRFIGLPLEGLRRKLTLRNMRALSLALTGFYKCYRLMKGYPNGIVFGVGGYVSAPAMAAGKWLGWKLTMHEQNTVPGLVNRVMAPKCDAVFTTYKETDAYLPNVDCQQTGYPLREELLEQHQSYGQYQQAHSVPSILLIGGSQGARNVVEKGLQALYRLSESGVLYRALVQTGEHNYEWAQQFPRGNEVTLTPFIDSMAEAYAVADLVISRAGSGSLAEIALWGLPSILIPYPFASENHQYKNAEVFCQANAACLLEEKDLTDERLASTLLDLIQDTGRRQAMSRQASSLAQSDAADRIAGKLLHLFEAR